MLVVHSSEQRVKFTSICCVITSIPQQPWTAREGDIGTKNEEEGVYGTNVTTFSEIYVD